MRNKGNTTVASIRRTRVDALYNDSLVWDRRKGRPSKTFVVRGRKIAPRVRMAARRAEIERNARELNADLKRGLPRLSNMVARSMLNSHREECRIRTAMVEAAHEAGADGICPWLGDLSTLF